jgi:hypothetical protein
MTIEVILKDMSTIYPSYDPEHRKEVIRYYSEQFELGNIVAWKIV